MASNRGGLSSSSSSSSLEELGPTTKPSRIDLSSEINSRIRNDLDHPTVSETMARREENPFSFKHFLNKDSSKNYQYAGARPKIYSTARINTDSCPLEVSGSLENEAVYSRNPTELPDFVQDHLVIEQCYLNHDSASGTQMIADVDNLPDFALNSVETRPMRHRGDAKKSDKSVGDLPFDLTGSLARRNRDRSMNTVPLETIDGPTIFGRLHEDSSERLETINFPLDLPVPPADSNNSSNLTDRNRSPVGDVSHNIPKSLPDFLNDGPIRNRVTPQAELSNSVNLNEPLDRRLHLEFELLRHDLEVARQQNDEKSRKIQMLEAELSSRRALDHEEAAHLEKAMEQVEDNLKRSTRRAVNAESVVKVLKQEIRALEEEISMLVAENRELRNALGAGCSTSRPVETDKKIHRLADDLKEAASSAESLLRQLMSGVDNLKVIASTLENVDRIEDRTKDFLLDFDEDNAAGPAL